MANATLTPVGDALYSRLLKDAPNSATPLLHLLESMGVSVGTHVGHRRKRNDDRSVVATIKRPDAGVYLVLAVCDGVGSSTRGNEAAAGTCAYIVDVLAHLPQYRAPDQILKEVVEGADDFVRAKLRGEGTTTLSLCVIGENGKVALTNVGDSRIYSWEPNASPIQLTQDDTIENELRQVKLENATVLDARNLRGTLSQAIGESGRTSKEIRIDIITKANIPPGGLLLASDGCWRAGESTFEKILSNAKTGAEAARRILYNASWVGGIDNATACVIESLPTAPFQVEESESPQIEVWTATQNIVLPLSPQKRERQPEPQERAPDLPLSAQKREKQVEPQGKASKKRSKKKQKAKAVVSRDLLDMPENGKDKPVRPELTVDDGSAE